MKASELIKELTSLIEKHGDIDVVIPATDCCYYGYIDINEITVNRDRNTLEPKNIELQ